MHNIDETRRVERPRTGKTITNTGILFFFGLGIGAMLAVVAVMAGLLMSYLSPRLELGSFGVGTVYRQTLPHSEDASIPAQALPATAPPALSSNSARDSQEDGVTSPIATPAVTPTAEVLPSPTLAPTATATVVAPTSSPPAVLAPVPASVQLSGPVHQWQTWNNCGPATVTMNMSYFGRTETQADAAQFLKPNRDDKNVSAQEMVAYVRQMIGLEAQERYGGSIEQLKLFLSNDLPVLVGTWLVHDGDGLGHYRLVIGYDDATRQFNTFDSLNGPNYKVSYEQFDADWRVFNRMYIPIYLPEQAPIVQAILGETADSAVMYEYLQAEAAADVAANPNDAIALFNQGDALTRLGRYEEAVIAFDQARLLGLHWRRLWYQFTPFEAYLAVGRYQDVLELAQATIKSTGGLEEAYYYHGLALQATGQPGAEEEFQAALNYNPNFTPAKEALNQQPAR